MWYLRKLESSCEQFSPVSTYLCPKYIKIWKMFLSKSESVKFSLIEPVICLFTDSSVQNYFSLWNHLIFTDWINAKIVSTVKSVDFHWSNQCNLTDLQ